MNEKLIDQLQMFRFVSLQDIESFGKTFDFDGLKIPIFDLNEFYLDGWKIVLIGDETRPKISST